MTSETDIKVEIRDLTMAYGSFVVMRNINARIKCGEIFIIMGGSGCGKSTLLRHMIGLKQPAQGDVFYDALPFGSPMRKRARRSCAASACCSRAALFGAR